jgi:transcriptional regulator with XRE-family HTH domain
MKSLHSTPNSVSVDVRVGRLIMIRRAVNRLSVLELSNISKVPPEIIEDFESGSLRPNPLQLAKLSECLSIPIDWFFSNWNADAVQLPIPSALPDNLSDYNDNCR